MRSAEELSWRDTEGIQRAPVAAQATVAGERLSFQAAEVEAGAGVTWEVVAGYILEEGLEPFHLSSWGQEELVAVDRHALRLKAGEASSLPTYVGGGQVRSGLPFGGWVEGGVCRGGLGVVEGGRRAAAASSCTFRWRDSFSLKDEGVETEKTFVGVGEWAFHPIGEGALVTPSVQTLGLFDGGLRAMEAGTGTFTACLISAGCECLECFGDFMVGEAFSKFVTMWAPSPDMHVALGGEGWQLPVVPHKPPPPRVCGVAATESGELLLAAAPRDLEEAAVEAECRHANTGGFGTGLVPSPVWASQ
ncbi:hypothetical protein CYMTET_25493 [Cymbomonas tetramitiformis]|uniref:Uncharacterized protein n=1 Tax=Cymbomonas tetramitiformis TaxID=36881 RepID=A0AAE0FU34_9CHLO|nr:hypothetical protein CYMTET_25493 [Cymbomonas tetramitiformis]